MKLKTWHKIVLGIIIFFAIILFAAPRVAKKYVVKNSTEIIGRKIDIDKIRLNYFSGVLRVSKLKLYEKDALTNFVSFNKLLVNLDYFPLLKKELLISQISLEDFYCNIEQEADVFNFSELLESNDSIDFEEETVDTTKTPMILTFNNITISNSQAHYTDILLDHTISLDDINLHIPGFSLNTGSTKLDLNFEFSQGGGLHTALTYDQLNGAFAVNLSLDSLNIDIIEPYIKNAIHVNEVNGYFSNDILVKGNTEHIMQIHMNGWNKIEALEILDQQDRNVLSFDIFNIDIDTFLLEQNEIRINEIALVNPFILFELIDSTNNWSAMMSPVDTSNLDSTKADSINSSKDKVALESQTKEELAEYTPASTIEPNQKTEFKYSLNSMELQNGLVNFKDYTLHEEFSAQLRQINITSKDITAGSSDVAVNLSAKLNETAQINSDIVLNLKDMKDISADLSLQQFSMEDIEPYLMTYFGYPVEAGLLNFTTSNDLQASTINSNNKLHIKNFDLGKANKDSARIKLPLKLVVGILSDRDGVIDLDLPVEMEGEKVSIANLGKTAFKIFSNLIVKAATSPIDFLSNLYGADPESLKKLEIGMFDHLLSQNSIESLDLIAKILTDKPKLGIELKYNIDEKHYYDSLATQLTTNEFVESLTSKQNTYRGEIPDSAIVSYISKKTIDESFNPNEGLSKLCVNYIGSDLLSAKLDSTKLEHYRIVHDYLVTQKTLDESRVNMLQSSEKTNPKDSTSIGFAFFNIEIKASGNE